MCRLNSVVRHTAHDEAEICKKSVQQVHFSYIYATYPYCCAPEGLPSLITSNLFEIASLSDTCSMRQYQMHPSYLNQ